MMIKFNEHSEDGELIVDVATLQQILNVGEQQIRNYVSSGVIVKGPKRGQYFLKQSIQNLFEEKSNAGEKNASLERRQEEKHSIDMATKYLEFEKGKEILIQEERQLIISTVKEILLPLQKFFNKLPGANKNKGRAIIKTALQKLNKVKK